MQIETLQNVPKTDAKSYLRIATISSKTALCFFYIGNDNHSIKFLTDSFKSGITAIDFESAKKVLSGEEAGVVDAIIIDLPYNEKDLKAFYFFHIIIDCINSSNDEFSTFLTRVLVIIK